jgi:hypothetical protein
MGKTISKKTINKTRAKGRSNNSVKRSTSIDDVVHDAMDFDPEKVLEEINSTLDVDDELILPDIANEVIEELKKSGELSSTLNNKEISDDDASKINDTLDKLTALSESLEKDINDRLGKLSDVQKKQLDNLTTSFWGGVLNTW